MRSLTGDLVACVNMAPVRSLYRWNGEFCDDEEHLLILKTRKDLVEAVIGELKALHPYEVPGDYRAAGHGGTPTVPCMGLRGDTKVTGAGTHE